MSLSPEQIESRKEGVTATDIAAILGRHPYRSAVDVWLDKTGKAAPFEGNERTRWGTLLEPVIRSDYEERRGVHVEVPGTLEHRERAWMKATPDGVVYQHSGAEPIGGLEIKCHTFYLSHLYGAPGSDEVPPYELCQVMWNMAVMDLPRWDLVAFIDGKPTDYTIDADAELIGIMTERAERFLVDNVRADKPPAPDGSDRYSEWLAGRYKINNAAGALRPIEDRATIAIVAKLRELRDQIAALEEQESIAVQAIKVAIGDHAGIEFPSKTGRGRERITWKQPRDSLHTNYTAALEQVRTSAALVATAKGDLLQRAIVALDKLSEVYFANSRATITGKEVRDLLVETSNVLTEIASPKLLETHTKLVPNSRKFLVPKSWSKDAQ